MTETTENGVEPKPPMNRREYMEAVARGEYPDSPLVPNAYLSSSPGYDGVSETRGTIENLCLLPVKSVSLLFSRDGTERAGHYHKTDWHFALILEGQAVYHWRKPGEVIRRVRIFAWDMIFSPPMVEHLFVFEKDTRMVTMAKNIRTHEEHEADVVRVKFFEDVRANRVG